MNMAELHGWRVSVAQAREIQLKLASQVSRVDRTGTPRYIAGVDISVNRAKDEATGAVVVLSYPALELVEVSTVKGKTEFPYVPGLLSFREAPLILPAYEQLSNKPDLILVDGQGIAHPRRIGIASHLGILLDKPTIGCAKSRLCGEFEMPGDSPGSYSELLDRAEVIGAVVRTRKAVKPLFISIGHKVDLPGAISWVLRCCRGYRLPEPSRLAHLAAGGNLPAAKKC
jgi:deoxyribonuclease V